MFSKIAFSVLVLTSSLLVLHILSFNTNYAFADFNFPAVGDWGCNSNTQKTVNNINSKGPERVLALGDYSYQDTATCWLNLVDDFDARMRIALGNHEDDDSEDIRHTRVILV